MYDPDCLLFLAGLLSVLALTGWLFYRAGRQQRNRTEFEAGYRFGCYVGRSVERSANRLQGRVDLRHPTVHPLDISAD